MHEGGLWQGRVAIWEAWLLSKGFEEAKIQEWHCVGMQGQMKKGQQTDSLENRLEGKPGDCSGPNVLDGW